MEGSLYRALKQVMSFSLYTAVQSSRARVKLCRCFILRMAQEQIRATL